MIKKRTKRIFQGVFCMLTVFYIFAVIKIVFLKDGIRLETNMYCLFPLNGLYEYKLGLKSWQSVAINYLGNIALFFPAGLLLPILFQKLGFLKTVLLGLLISFGVEILQYILSSGYTDIDDVIMNTAGCALGAVTYFYIFSGRKKSLASYVLSLLLILVAEVGSIVAAWYFAPNLLPDQLVELNGRIAGRKLDQFDAQLKCYQMSHGDIFIIPDTVRDIEGNKISHNKTYSLSDTAIYVTESQNDGKTIYHILGIDDMIAAVSRREETSVKIWLADTGECQMVMLERN